MARLKPLPKNSRFNVRTLAVLLVVWIAVMGFFMHFFYGPSAGATGMGKVEKHELYASAGEGSIGRERQAMLVDATRRYVTTHPDAPTALSDGKALAPAEYLNEELTRLHAKFRVRDVNGMKANIYEVS